MRYMLLFCGSDEDRRAFDAMTEEQLRARYVEVARWFSENDERIVASEQLQPRDAATTLRFASEGEPLVTDGPFVEGREDIGGYATIDAADFDAALAMARAWPGRGSVEIRPVVER
jgi:hypothetical protein